MQLRKSVSGLPLTYNASNIGLAILSYTSNLAVVDDLSWTTPSPPLTPRSRAGHPPPHRLHPRHPCHSETLIYSRSTCLSTLSPRAFARCCAVTKCQKKPVLRRALRLPPLGRPPPAQPRSRHRVDSHRTRQRNLLPPSFPAANTPSPPSSLLVSVSPNAPCATS